MRFFIALITAVKGGKVFLERITVVADISKECCCCFWRLNARKEDDDDDDD